MHSGSPEDESCGPWLSNEFSIRVNSWSDFFIPSIYWMNWYNILTFMVPRRCILMTLMILSLFLLHHFEVDICGLLLFFFMWTTIRWIATKCVAGFHVWMNYYHSEAFNIAPSSCQYFCPISCRTDDNPISIRWTFCLVQLVSVTRLKCEIKMVITVRIIRLSIRMLALSMWACHGCG